MGEAFDLAGGTTRVNDNVNFYAGGARGAVTLREHIQLHAEYTPIDRI